MAEQTKSDWKERELGALWTREGKSGKFWSGKISLDGKDVDIIVYKNKDKGDNDKAPSLRVYKDRPFNRDSSESKGASNEDDDLPL